MRGISIIRHSAGWGITNEATINNDKHLVDIDGKKHSKNVLTIKNMFVFDVVGKVSEGDRVECLFKSEKNEKRAFAGKIKLRKGSLTVIDDLQSIDHLYNEILKQVKR